MGFAKGWLVVLVIPLVLVGCWGGESGKDKIRAEPQATPETAVMDCTACHTPASSAAATLTGDDGKAIATGTGGQHPRHVAELGFTCETCHFEYFWEPTHLNGTLDVGEPSVSIVRFNGRNPQGTWSGGGDPDTASCANVSCHGGNEVHWYRAENITCTSCHSSGGLLDPIVLNGTGSEGKHETHVVDRGIDCQTCHNGYDNVASHDDGTFNSAATGTDIIFFDTLNANASWDIANQSCGYTWCHGGSDGSTSISSAPAWYGTETITCPSCHASGSFIDPLSINGTGAQGKHVRHVTGKDYSCLTCHANYNTNANHVNGVLDKDNPAASLIAFDNRNPSGTWTDGAGSCGSTYCHGGSDGTTTVANAPLWYGTSPLTCTDCHSSGSFIDPMVINGSGLDGKHQAHRGGFHSFGFACTQCHADISDLPEHENGQFETDTATLIVTFDSLNPDASWVGDTRAGTGGCASTFCHQATVEPEWYSSTQNFTCIDCHP